MSVGHTADPSATLMVAVCVGCMALLMVSLGVPLLWVLNGLVALMTFGLLYLSLRAIRRVNR